jgi:23S rRNA (uracil1939-C5)-methyltransferase
VPYLTYTLPAEDIRIRFRPTDFIQISQEINRSMVGRALEYLAPQPGDRILDLFCGLGNFTLPLARRGAMVVGIEGEAALVSRADENAGANGLTANARFITADLAASVPALPWESSYPLSREKEPAADEQQIVPKLLLDPPRTGAEGAIRALSLRVFSRIVYISCDPATLARDTAILVKEQGYRLTAAGIMDMFPHTSHVESIAIFDRKQ